MKIKTTLFGSVGIIILLTITAIQTGSSEVWMLAGLNVIIIVGQVIYFRKNG